MPNAQRSAEIARTAAKALGVTPREVSQISGNGTVNEIFLVETPSDRLIVRLNLGRTQDEALAEYRMESWCIAAAERSGVPSPTVLDVRSIEDRAAMVQSFVPGAPGSALPHRSEELWEAIGDYARRIHQIDMPPLADRATVFIQDADRPAEDVWRAQLDLNIESLGSGDPLLAHGVYLPRESDDVRQAFRALRDLTAQFGIYHGDLALRNLLASEGRPPVLIDWGCAGIGLAPLRDLIEIYRHHLLEGRPDERGLQAFGRGYGWSRSELNDWLGSARTLAVLKAFDLVRWAIDRKSERLDQIVAEAKRLKSQLFTMTA